MSLPPSRLAVSYRVVSFPRLHIMSSMATLSRSRTHGTYSFVCGRTSHKHASSMSSSSSLRRVPPPAGAGADHSSRNDLTPSRNYFFCGSSSSAPPSLRQSLAFVSLNLANASQALAAADATTDDVGTPIWAALALLPIAYLVVRGAGDQQMYEKQVTIKGRKRGRYGASLDASALQNDEDTK